MVLGMAFGKCACVLGMVALAAGIALAADGGPEYYVAPDGKAENAGTKEAPWDIASALGGKQTVAPGATIWLAAGVYKCPERTPGGRGFPVRLAGAEDKPIVVRSLPGERATIDGGLNVVAPTAWLWIRDLEIMVSETERTTKIGGSGAPSDLARPWGGLEILAGSNCKYINLVIHDNNQGVGFWTPATDSELYGCLIYDNGWIGPDRGHGHCIYSQNKDGIKTIADNILCIKYNGTYSMHAYGSARADCDNFLIEGNIAFGGGPFLVGSGKPSHNIRVFKNYLYGVSMQIGYGAANIDCQISDNVVLNSGIGLRKYEKVVAENNLIVGGGINFAECKEVQQKDNVTQKPGAPQVVLRPNKYDPNRANLAIFNWARAPQVEVDATGFLKHTEKYVLRDPKDFFGKPVGQGVCENGKITVAMPVAPAAEGQPAKPVEFAAFVMVKER